MSTHSNPTYEIPAEPGEEAHSARQNPVRKGKNPWVWATLLAILAFYVFGALRTKPMASWGVFVDSGTYFTSAKAIASGQGYTLPWFPGHLPSMKFPELFPLILSGVWRLDPHFPGNLAFAVGVALAFGCLALIFSFLMLRRWPGLGDWPALGIVLLVSLMVEFVVLSPMVLTDIPFMALMLGAAWLAEESLSREHAAWAAGAGVLAGMSVGLRSAGVPVAAGIGLLLLFRREFRKLFWFCLTGLPLTLFWSWPAVSAVLGLTAPAVAGNPARSGWTQTLCFYTSYACQWKMSVPSLAGFRSAVVQNLLATAREPGAQLSGFLANKSGSWGLLLMLLLSAVSYVGIARSWRRSGCRPLHAIFPLYLLLVVAYPFAPDRFLVPFAPLFVAGLWLEGRHIYEVVASRLKRGCGGGERVVAWVLGLGTLAIGAVVAFNLVYLGPHYLGSFGKEQEQTLNDEMGAFSWLRGHSSPKARVVAHQDALTYLYTGRESIRPIYFVTDAEGLTAPRYIERDADHLGDVARHVHASYWLECPFDSTTQSASEKKLLQAKEQELLATASVVYRSPDGEVTLYDTRCVFGALPTAECGAAASEAASSARSEGRK